MSWFELLATSIVQGLTEFLPLSSSGHLVIAHHLWGATEPTLFVDVLLHLGTTLAVLVVLRRTIAEWLTREPRHLVMVGIAMVPTVVSAVWLRDAAELSTLQLRRVGFEFVITGLWLFAGHWLSRRRHPAPCTLYAAPLLWWQALLIGAAQGIAVLPAISRSAATISTALAVGVAPVPAVQFSLLLSVPAVLAAALFETAQAEWVLPHQLSLMQSGVAFILTFVVGWASIRALQWLTVRRRLIVFAWYCGLLGLWLVFGGLS